MSETSSIFPCSSNSTEGKNKTDPKLDKLFMFKRLFNIFQVKHTQRWPHGQSEGAGAVQPGEEKAPG